MTRRIKQRPKALWKRQVVWRKGWDEQVKDRRRSREHCRVKSVAKHLGRTDRKTQMKRMGWWGGA